MEEFLIKASDAGDIESTFELAKLKQSTGDFETTLELFKKANRAGNISAMQNAVNICEDKKDFYTLKEFAKIIQSRYNDVYNTTDFFQPNDFFLQQRYDRIFSGIRARLNDAEILTAFKKF